MNIKLNKSYLFFKRVFDLVSSSIGLIILAIPMILISLAIKIDDGGSIFFKQKRVGKDFEVFEILKFRTMVEDAPNKGRQITADGDDRITKVGHVLRKFKLDELPQLINVFLGQMSVVGPRPEVPKYVDMYDEKQRQVLLIKPGITDLASIEYRSESEILAKADDPEKVYIEEIMPHKLSLNLEYIEEMSFIYDIKLILKTFLVIVKV